MILLTEKKTCFKEKYVKNLCIITSVNTVQGNSKSLTKFNEIFSLYTLVENKINEISPKGTIKGYRQS